jgi:UDP-N-acetylglucosamine diphosphorylase / glucose-1-phosphate thymidylyltransferase / UDP-N-acetylgalactosamine diphosphorylase / glucosamine-1-phosphate N-acetyltransferase / galactosamine-1-phosphate N-acetyltransferase
MIIIPPAHESGYAKRGESTVRICLFEDGWQQLEPLSATRPVFELVCGITPLGEKQRRCLGATDWGVCIRPALAALFRRQHPDIPVNEYGWLLSSPMALVNGRWLPPATSVALPDWPCVGIAGDQVVFAVLSDEQLASFRFSDLALVTKEWQHVLPRIDVGGRLIDYPWDLIEHNAAAIAKDVSAVAKPEWPHRGDAVSVVGPADRVWLAPSARIEPFVVADTLHGPVVIDEQAVVTAFTRLEGPCYIGPRSQVMGAKIRGGTTIGPHCRIGGEVEASIVHGYSNKYHEGFLGHSYVGEWVNLGAGTHNSDLRNDYGPVSVPMPGQVVKTGRTKVGCFIGDHVKTGLGTLINTGSHLGAFSNLLPAGRLAPKYIPAFTTWWNGNLTEEFPLDQLLQTAERMMQRRGQQLSEEHLALYETMYHATSDERHQVLQENEMRLWRHSA